MDFAAPLMVDGRRANSDLFSVVPSSLSSGDKDDLSDILTFLDIGVCVANPR
jgi:hypothetical protein